MSSTRLVDFDIMRVSLSCIQRLDLDISAHLGLEITMEPSPAADAKCPAQRFVPILACRPSLNESECHSHVSPD
jgi:hypothetical protein